MSLYRVRLLGNDTGYTSLAGRNRLNETTKVRIKTLESTILLEQNGVGLLAEISLEISNVILCHAV